MASTTNIDNLTKVSIGTNPQNGAMIFKTGAPLDDRAAVACKEALISANALGVDKQPDPGWMYKGMMCVDAETGDMYTLIKDPASATDRPKLYTNVQIKTMTETEIQEAINFQWKKINTEMSDVETLINDKVATLFQFKGVAISVSQDYTALTIGTAMLAENVLQCFRADYDLAHNLFYAWSTDPSDSEVVIYYTDSPSIGTNTIIYEANSSPISVSYIEYMNEVYMPEGAAVNGVTTWLPLYTDDVSEGSPIYSKSIDGITKYSFDNTFTTTLTDVTSDSYEGRTFSTIDNPGITGNSRLEFASDSNNGHVYQIKEDEYASNGATWVQLGSPKTDWIIL